MMTRHSGFVCFVGAWLAISSIAVAACVSDTDGDGVCDDLDTCPGTVQGATVDSTGCPFGIPGDYDRDGDVDLADLASFSACQSGPGIPANSACQSQGFDFDLDTDVDMLDFSAFQRCFSGQGQPASPDCASHLAIIKGGCLHIIGTAADTSLALRLKPGVPTILEIDVGNDGLADFSLDRGRFNCIVVDAGGGNDLVWIDEANGVFTDTEQTTINGGEGSDTLLGGSGAETFNGGPGDDSVYMGAGDDTFVWNPGDDADLIEGGGDMDTITVNGTDDAETFTVTANGTRVRFDRVNPLPFFLDIGTSEKLVLNANGGDDTASCVGNLAALIQITLDGGPGDDTLLGSNGADLLIGGDDNDFVDGNQGNDLALLGDGDDVFQWDPGDGSDTIEGQAGTDTLSFNASNANENISISANGSRLRLFRDVGSITTDGNGIEKVNLQALGGTDNVTVSDLAGTDVTQVNVDLAASLGGNAGDAQADNVIIAGTPGADVFNVSADSGFVVVGLAADVRVKGYEAGDQVVFNGVGGDLVDVNGSSGPDTMTVTANGTQARVDGTGFSAGVAVSGALSLAVNGLGGPDTISCSGNLASLLVPITLDGGPGDDTLLGSNGADTLIGGDDNDFVDGNQGNDLALLGDGDDVFQWDPGDGSDTVEGQAGTDTLIFNGSAVGEIFDLSANGARVRFTRNVGNITMDIDGVEQFNLRALGGVDALTVDSLAGTAVTQVSVDLAGSLGGVTGDAQVDTITVNGTAAPDTIDISANSGTVVVAGLAAEVDITHSEAANDSLIVNGLGGLDAITQGPGVAALIGLTINQD
jgi:hypothetical protein